MIFRRRPETRSRPVVGYVCGALRVSTNDSSESVGPRAHVVGFLDALSASQLNVRSWIAGDQVRTVSSRFSSDKSMRGSRVKKLAIDMARLAFRFEARRRACNDLGNVELLYERQATFQDIGRAYRRKGVPWIIESNGPFWYEASKERKTLALVRTARRLELAAYRDADLVVVVSDALRDIIAKESGRSADDILVLPNATDARRFDPSRIVKTRRLTTGPIIGFVGYLTKWAGLDLLIQSISSLRDEGVSISAVIVGDGPARSSLEEFAREKRISEKILFVGNVPWSEVPEYLAGFDLAYSGQRVMGVGAMYHSPQKLYEYRAMGLPIVAADHADARNLIEDRVDGYIFKSDDVGSLLSALRVAASDPQSSERRLKIRSSIMEDHTWDRRVRTLLDELRSRGLLKR